MNDVAMSTDAPMSLPVLDLSGQALRGALESLVEAAESDGGVDAYVRGLGVKVALFVTMLNAGRVGEMSEVDFLGLCNFMPTVRRRIAAWLADHGYAPMRHLLTRLIEAPGEVDARFGDFVACFPSDRSHRWVRDLAAEVLHFTQPEQVPLMTRWMWDARTATGVLREIWFDDSAPIDALGIPDRLPTFLALRAELDAFLRDNGFFRDRPLFQDLLCAHIYAGYINDRGSSYLKGEFAGGEDPMNHTRRLLGLDALDRDGFRNRLKMPSTDPPPRDASPRIGH